MNFNEDQRRLKKCWTYLLLVLYSISITNSLILIIIFNTHFIKKGSSFEIKVFSCKDNCEGNKIYDQIKLNTNETCVEIMFAYVCRKCITKRASMSVCYQINTTHLSLPAI